MFAGAALLLQKSRVFCGVFVVSCIRNTETYSFTWLNLKIKKEICFQCCHRQYLLLLLLLLCHRWTRHESLAVSATCPFIRVVVGVIRPFIVADDGVPVRCSLPLDVGVMQKNRNNVVSELRRFGVVMIVAELICWMESSALGPLHVDIRREGVELYDFSSDDLILRTRGDNIDESFSVDTPSICSDECSSDVACSSDRRSFGVAAPPLTNNDCRCFRIFVNQSTFSLSLRLGDCNFRCGASPSIT